MLEEKKKVMQAYEVLKRGYKITKSDLILDQVARVTARQLAAENFPSRSYRFFSAPIFLMNSIKRWKTKDYSDDVFSVSYPACLQPLKKESAVIFHNAPEPELLHEDKGKYLTLLILRIPPKIHLDFYKEFWPGLEKELLQYDPNAITGESQLLGFSGRKIVADTKAELGLAARVTMQISAASPNGILK